ncbi:uncharacterized protein PRCAT00002154001 [Priceomyces carsonii]|uniref:uncharacterized protein n=1 Tax=Priceomyces carsonii TaxID=28549 RepID=UPI002ED89B41|nr:unnamed protein product [Priceomyces carsonii]
MKSVALGKGSRLVHQGSQDEGQAPSSNQKNDDPVQTTTENQGIVEMSSPSSKSVSSPNKINTLRFMFRKNDSTVSSDSMSDNLKKKNPSLTSLPFSTNSGGSETSPSRKHKSISGNLANVLGANFAWSKSSLSSAQKSTDNINAISTSTLQSKRVGIEAFADTSSENEVSKSSNSEEYDEESISSILEEYGIRSSVNVGSQRADFIFLENFDDSSSTANPDRSQTTERTSNRFSRSSSLRSKPPLERNINVGRSAIRASSSSSNSEYFDSRSELNLRTSDKQEEKERKHSPSIPTQESSNLQNRSHSNPFRELGTKGTVPGVIGNPLNVGMQSDSPKEERYPEPDLVDINTPLPDVNSGVTNKDLLDATSNLISQPEQKPNTFKTSIRWSQIIPEETIKNKRISDRSSLSSGELLSRLEQYDESSKRQSEVSASDSFKHATINLTAGLDSNTELPIMLYKVQEKGYDESNKRWSVYESNRGSDLRNDTLQIGSRSLLPMRTASGTNSSDSSSATNSRSKTGPSNKVDTGKEVTTQRSSSPPNYKHPSPSIPMPIPSNMLLDTLAKRTSHERMFDTDNTNNNYNDTTIISDGANNLLISQDDLNSSHSYELQYNYDQEKWIQATSLKVIYSNVNFALMMLLGLLVPPIYFLVPVGAFDSTNAGRHHHFPLSQLGNQGHLIPVGLKRYSKNQKLLSFALGIIWLTIILAMIGVGIGVGVTRESR